MADPKIATVRILIADTTETTLDKDNNQIPGYLLTDDQITSLLTLCNWDAYRAAAQALEVIATSEVLVSKKIRTQDLQTDGPAVAAELRALAKSYRDRAAEGDAQALAGEGPYFAAVSTVPGRWPYGAEATERTFLDGL